MQAVIGGKMYNTATATEIGYYSNNLGVGDFNNVEETLYKTAKGAYFLHGKGGPATGWAQPSAGGWCGGSGIRPLSAQEALDWAERGDAMSANEIAAEFSDLVVEA